MILVAVVSGGWTVSAVPDVDESTISATVLHSSNDSLVWPGETIRIAFDFTETVNYTPAPPEATLDFWLDGSKTTSRNLNFRTRTRPPVPFGPWSIPSPPINEWIYKIDSDDPEADYLELNVGNVCNSSGNCSDPSPKRINVSVVSLSSYVSVSNTSNLDEFMRRTESGGTINFSAGVYEDLQLNVSKPLTLISDTGDYRTSGVVITGNVSLWINGDDVTVKGFRFENVTSSAIGQLPNEKRGVIRVGDGPSNLRFEKNGFTNVTGPHATGINLIRGDVGRQHEKVFVVDNKYVHSSGDFVLAVHVDDSVFKDNVVNNVSGAAFILRDGDNVSFLNNGIDNVGLSGIDVTGTHSTNVYVKDNVIGNADLSPHDGVFPYGAIVFTDGSAGIIEGNTITGSHDGIISCPYCRGDLSPESPQISDPVNLVVRNNVIHSNAGRYDVFNSPRNPVMRVFHNYWGSPDGPDLGRLSGNVVHDLPYYVSRDDLVNDSLNRFAINKENLTSGDHDFQFNVSGIIQNVSLNLGGNFSYVRMLVEVLDSRPENADRVSSSMDVYRYFEITHNLDDSPLVGGADITFKVPKSWLDSNNLDRDAVVLLRYDDDGWEDLGNLRVVNQDRDEVIFSREIPGFSFFAIAGTPASDDDGGRRSSGKPSENETADDEKEVVAPEEKEMKDEETSPPAPTPVPVTDEIGGNDTLVWILGALAGVVVLVVVVVLLRRKNLKKMDE